MFCSPPDYLPEIRHSASRIGGRRGGATIDTSVRKKKKGKKNKKSGVGDGNDGMLVPPDETSSGSLFRRPPKNLINVLNEVLLHSGRRRIPPNTVYTLGS